MLRSSAGGLHQRGDVGLGERLEPDVGALEREGLKHAPAATGVAGRRRRLLGVRRCAGTLRVGDDEVALAHERERADRADERHDAPMTIRWFKVAEKPMW